MDDEAKNASNKAVTLEEFVESVRQNKCPMCKKTVDIGSFNDLLSLREFEQSGVCQKCQDIYQKGREMSNERR